MSFLVAQIVDTVTPVHLLIGATSALTVAIGALYRDCRRDRDKLWQHVRDLEKRL